MRLGHQTTLAIFEKNLGENHTDVATLLNNLANLYRDQGRYNEAEALCQRSLSIFENALGNEHPHTRQGRHNYAALLRATGRIDQAEAMEAEGFDEDRP